MVSYNVCLWPYYGLTWAYLFYDITSDFQSGFTWPSKIHWNIGGGTGRPGQEGTITFSNSWGVPKIYGFDLPVVNFPFLGSNTCIPASWAYGVYIQSWSAMLEFVSNTVTS
jgi:hypothetical protein